CTRYKESCHHVCTNIPGSFKCSCHNGYRMTHSGQCIGNVYNLSKALIPDFGCLDGRSNCQQICINREGFFQCKCYDGYTYNTNNNTCIRDVDECQSFHKCIQHCRNTNGSYDCSCHYGYKLLKDQRTCEDINECELNRDHCEHKCENVDGWYNCLCFSGYILRWYGETCSQDLDDCSSTPCPSNLACYNQKGPSYSCGCDSGYKWNTTLKICQDVDECSREDHGCEHTCVNQNGTYACECDVGFLKDGFSCSNIDECLVEDDNGCEHICFDTQGSYFCGCHDGYELELDIKSCKQCKNNN
ncbi:hypothetical protein LOTGIDRAFT_133333, partial [Lottia gigantea]